MQLKIALAIFLFMNVFFLIALVKKNYAVVDIGWGLGFILIALISYLHSPLQVKNAVLMAVVLVWGLRLALYLFSRNKGKPEDFRYAMLRGQWGARANSQAYLKVFLFQGFLMYLISLPVTVGMTTVSDLSLINKIGILVWIMGFSLEVASDHYLTWHKTRNPGVLCTSGPWRLCRFPNYFGEVLLWYGVYLVSFSVASSWTVIGPVTINFLILKVTGVPILEQKYLRRSEYIDYAKRVPRFIPFTKSGILP